MSSAHLVGLTFALLQIASARLESLQSFTQCLTLENHMPPGDWLEVQNVFPFPISTGVGAVDILDAIDIREYRRSGMNMCLKYSHEGNDVTHAVSVKSKIIDADSAGVHRRLTVVDLDQPSVVRVVEGQEVKLACSATGHPIPNVDWVQSRPLFSALAGVPGRVTGTVLSAQPEHAGLYTCRAENDHVRVNQQVKLVVVPNRPASPPKFSRRQVSTIWRTEGARVELTCEATGQPVPFIDWSGGPLFSGRRGVPGRDTGIFESVTLDNSGDYTCTAENDAGISTVRRRLRVYSERACVPALPDYPGSIPAPRPPGCPPGPPTFPSFQFRCRPGELPGPDCNPGYGAFGGPVRPSYTAGMQGLPSGPAAWPGQPVGPPISAPEPPSPPSISFNTSFVYTVTEGEDVQITCSADGSPSPRVAWIHPIQLLTTTSQSTSDTSVTATVLNVTRHNAGAYYCSAENSVGTAVAWVNLLVEARDEVAEREPLIVCPPGPSPPSTPPWQLPCPPPGPPGSPRPPHCRLPGPRSPPSPLPHCFPGAPGEPPICGPPIPQPAGGY